MDAVSCMLRWGKENTTSDNSYYGADVNSPPENNSEKNKTFHPAATGILTQPIHTFKLNRPATGAGFFDAVLTRRKDKERRFLGGRGRRGGRP